MRWLNSWRTLRDDPASVSGCAANHRVHSAVQRHSRIGRRPLKSESLTFDMGLGSFLGSGSIVAISPGPLLGSTLALAALWVMRQHNGPADKFSGNSRRRLPTASPPSCVVPELSSVLGGQSKDESGPGFDDWVLLMTTRFRGRPWLLQRPGQPDVLVVSDPMMLEDIQRTYTAQFAKVDGWEGGFLARDAHGAVMAGEDTTEKRRSLSKAQRKKIAEVLKAPTLHIALSELVEKHCGALLAVLDKTADCSDNGAVDMTTLMRTFAMEVFAELGLGVKLGGLDALKQGPSTFEQAVDDVQTRLMQRSNRLTAFWSLKRLLNLGDEAAVSHSRSVVNATIFAAFMTKRGSRGGSSGDCDILSLLLKAEGASKYIRDPKLLGERVLGLVLAARDSTAYTLTMCLHCLAQHPEEQTKLQQALDKGEGSDANAALLYVEAVLKETLRLFPPKPFIRRRALEDIALSDGTFVAVGTQVAMAVYSTARREDVWGCDAAKFRPQRWIDAKIGRLRPASHYKFNTFLAGPRACPGTTMALTETKAVLLAVLTKFSVEPVQKKTASGATSSTEGPTCRMPPRGNHIKVQLRRRRHICEPAGEYS